MVAISRQLEQRSVKRRYYHGEFVPGPKDFIATVKRDVASIAGFDLVDVAGGDTLDEDGAACFQYTALFQRDGTTLEAKIDIQNEKLIAEAKADPNNFIEYLHDELKVPEHGGSDPVPD